MKKPKKIIPAKIRSYRRRGIPISGKELIRQILEKKERDLSFTVLKRDENGYCDLTKYKDDYEALNKYLREQKPDKEHPILVLNYSKMSGLKADGIYLPFLLASYANFEFSILTRANFSGANITLSDFEKSDLEQANLENARLCFTYLQSAKLTEANLRNANLFGSNLACAVLSNGDVQGAIFSTTNLLDADLRGVRNLESAIGLGSAVLKATLLDMSQKAYIQKIIERKPKISEYISVVR